MVERIKFLYFGYVENESLCCGEIVENAIFSKFVIEVELTSFGFAWFGCSRLIEDMELKNG